MELLIWLRKEHDLTKVQMARRLRIAKSYYTMLENGDRPISKNIGLRIHEEFGIPLERIFFDPEVHAKETKEEQAAAKAVGE